VRNSFFRSEDGFSLKYTETSPPNPAEACPHLDCGCTRSVAERPSGIPDQVTTRIELSEDGQGLEAFSFGFSGNWATFGQMATDPHAYFMFDRKTRGIRFEVYLPDHRHGYLFANLFMGTEAHTSQRLYNGHSPSKIAALYNLGDDVLWLYECRWGVEGYKVFVGPEAEEWRKTISLFEEIETLAAPLLCEESADVDALRTQAEKNETLRLRVEDLRTRLYPFATNMRSTELFKNVEALDAETKATHERGRASDMATPSPTGRLAERPRLQNIPVRSEFARQLQKVFSTPLTASDADHETDGIFGGWNVPGQKVK